MRLLRLFVATLAYSAVIILSLFIVLQVKETLRFNVRKQFQSTEEKFFDFKLEQKNRTEKIPVNLIRGIKRTEPGFLTIGLCSVPRKNISYLKETLHSLIDNMGPIDMNNITIVLYLGSFDDDWVNQTLNFVDMDFSNVIQKGLLHVVQPDPDIYPNFTQITKRTYNDPVKRVHWRVKQNIDYAYLYGYCEQLNKYFLHLEDDNIAASYYVKEIQEFVNGYEATKKYWFRIDFGRHASIGMLFKSSDLEKNKQYLLLFQEEKPIDFMMDDMLIIMNQGKKILSRNSVFKHRGRISSLENKTMNVEDLHFKKFRRQLPQKDEPIFYLRNITHINPIANISTSIKTYDRFRPEKAYISTLGDFFWGQSPVADDFYQIRFNKTIKLHEIIIKTGHPKTEKDILQNASLIVGNNVNSGGKCIDMKHIGVFDDKGQVHIKHDMDVRCVVVVVTAKQKSWIIIQEIKIIT